MPAVNPISDDLSDRLIAFGTSVAGTSLYLLRAIEATVDHLEAGERLARAVAENASLLTSVIAGRKPEVGQFLDPNDSVINALESGYRGLEQHLPQMLLRKDAIDANHDLSGHCDLLHVAFDRHISAFAELIENAKNLRAAVISHDLTAEPRNQQSFESLEPMLVDLRKSLSV